MTDNKNRLEIIDSFRKNGVCIPCDDGVIIDSSAQIGKGVTIFPNTIILGNTIIGDESVIGPNSFIENCIVGKSTRLNNTHAFESQIGNLVTAGPFVHIRPNTTIEDKVHIGNFVEVKNSFVDKGSKLPHLLYVGDSDVGKDVNFGCGCVTVNYDGRTKSRTTVKDGAFLGCNTNLVAPVTVGENAFTAAGSTITEDIPDNSLAIARTEQIIKENWVNEKKPYKRQHQSRG
jgi:bifunctional UDP-N-acetylglucosamine pyrophosphorylase/glucosamine-1-phosphate N-acetyltransferase